MFFFQVQDIFALSAVTFGSPLQDGQTSMTSLESQPGFFQRQPLAYGDSEGEDDPYEDIEEIRRNLRRPDVEAPEPPPRNCILKPESVGSRKAEDNIYSDLETGGERETNLMDARLEESSESEQEHEYAVTEEHQTELGARPKTYTIDIRSKVSQWYEEAEKEVERDLALDISTLEVNGPAVRKSKPKPSYEHVSLAFSGRPIVGDGEVVPRPTQTLLRDFDPCHLAEEAEEHAREMAEREVTNTLYDSMDQLSISSGATPRPGREPPAPRPRNKVPAVVKKINFGPPKPPRSFNYSQLGKSDEEDSQMCDKPIKNYSPSDEKPSSRKSDVPMSPKKSAKNKVKQQLDDLSLFRASRRKGGRKDSLKEEEEEEVRREENLYVTLPLNRLSHTSDSSPEESPRPPSEPPPPLPITGPPGSRQPRTSVYENVWVEQCSPLPPVPARPARREAGQDKVSPGSDGPQTKTHLLDSRFQGRKASLESLASQRTRSHTKSESIDSGSSASSYSIASESPQPPRSGGELGSSCSAEHLDRSADSSPGKGKIKKFPNTRSFTVANLGPKLNKLPEMATSIRRRMSNQFSQAGSQVISPTNPSQFIPISYLVFEEGLSIV